jgi:PAS domain S-box-containing protein
MTSEPSYEELKKQIADLHMQNDLFHKQQLLFSSALNSIAEIILLNENPNDILENTNRIIGETLQVDRTLIYEISFENDQITSLCEWLKLQHPDITPTKDGYTSLEIFLNPLAEINNTKKYLESHYSAINNHFIKGGSGKILHEHLNIKSLLWYPFDFDKQGFHLFTLKQILSERQWSTEEISFIGSVAKQVSIALMKNRLLVKQKNEFAKNKESEKKFRLIAQNTSDGILVIGADTQIQYVSAAYCKQLGYSEKDELSRNSENIYSVIHPEDRAPLFNKIFKAIEKKKNELVYTYRVKHKDGHYIFREDNAKFNYDNDGNHINTYVICRDITERKKIEEELIIANATLALQKELITAKEKVEESEEKARVLLDNLPCIAMIIQKDNRKIIATNSKAKEMGADIGKMCHQLWNNCSQSCEFCRLTDAFQDEKATECEIFLNGKYYHCIWLPLNHEQCVHYIFDVTGRKQAEQALKESEEKYRFLSDNVSDGILLFEANNKLKYISEGCLKMLDYELQDMDYLNFDDIFSFFHEDDVQQVKEIFKSSHLKQIESFQFNYRLKIKDGRYIWTEDKVKAEYDSYGNHVRSVHHIRNISERKQSELFINQQNEELKKLNADKDRFITILAHDLKSPFNSILGFLGLLTENIRTYDIEKIEKQINIVNNSAKTTFALLEDILMWVRANSGKIPYEPQKLNFGTICEDIIESLKQYADSKEITINNFLADEINIFADKNMLNTILRNLVSNSIKFTNRNGRIDIYAETNRTNAIITVSDNGIGIEPDTINKLFDISQIITKTGTANENGTGFGLILCKEFVEKHYGKIWAESEFGNGCNFKFTMPLCKY